MNLKSVKIIAVDFDGTLCENSWPEIGEPNEELIEYLRNRKKDGDKLILWTCRVEDMLQKAVEWCKERNLVFDAVNENLPEIIENFGSDTRKIFANEYIDDRNIWPLKDDVTDVLYLCDGKSCGDTCPGVECKHTSDISHAKNFAKDAYDSYWEKEAESETKDPGSHEKSDSGICKGGDDGIGCENCANYDSCEHTYDHSWQLGKADHDLMMRLADTRYRRMITVNLDITAPLYWWKDFYTYEVGTVANSCSTMHKITAKEFEWSDFSTEHLLNFGMWGEQFTDADAIYAPAKTMGCVISALNGARDRYLDFKSRGSEWTELAKRAWWQMTQLLPSSYNQKWTVMLNYEVLAGIYPMLRNHELDEWVKFCKWIEALPYSDIIIGRVWR